MISIKVQITIKIITCNYVGSIKVKNVCTIYDELYFPKRFYYRSSERVDYDQFQMAFVAVYSGFKTLN